MTPYYEKDGITIYCGDCLAVMGEVDLSGVNCVITSPPYNLGGEPWPRLGHWKPGDSAGGKTKWRNGSDAGGGTQYRSHKDCMPWDEYVSWQRSILGNLWDLLPGDGAIFYNHKPRVIGARVWLPLQLIPPSVVLRQIVIWARPGGMNFNPTAFVPTHEWIMVLARDLFRLKSKGVSGLGDVWSMAPDSNPHPAPFPLALPGRVIDAVAPKAVLDPFMGSGTTLMAAKLAGVRAIGIELDENYCKMAVERLRQNVLPMTA